MCTAGRRIGHRLRDQFIADRDDKRCLREYCEQAPLSSTGEVESTVASMTLPAGNWIVHADDSVVGNVPDIARCWLHAPGAPVVGHATQLVPYVATVSETIGFKLSSPGVVTNTCSHDSTVPTSDYFYVDPEATMWAHKVRSLTIITKQ